MAHGHLAGFGCILMNDQGDWIGGCSGSLQENSILRCELFAIWKGLYLACESSFQRIICETDSLDAYNLLKLDSPFVMEHTDLVFIKIKDMQLWPWSLHINLI
ncbi:hypothetical protein PIB30_073012 [Stylosanthes scabra]|uniref:RNase H type-1 domain-containing protein n=1 Tax=Stylosanthes scabra TaxID=79078 RepID=A0ABU6URN9_9FABA|nr:hypothetical protein [Stylosanthes scabra]